MPAPRRLRRNPEDFDRQNSKIQAARDGEGDVIGASGEHGSRFKQKVKIKTPLCPHSPQARDLVLHVQFLPFQFQELEVVGGGVGERFANLLFERFVTFLKFRKMRFNRHVSCLLASISSFSSSIFLPPTTKRKPSMLLALRKSPFCTARDLGPHQRDGLVRVN